MIAWFGISSFPTATRNKPDESVADEFEMPFEQAADKVAMLFGLARELMGQTTWGN